MTPPDDRLDELRHRWEEEPGSRVSLQLADEYRRAGRHGEALEVLEKGLEQNPNQVSALVLQGRVLLESGEAGRAVGSLERAVEVDPTNQAAMKLAVEAYLEQGDRDKAAERLELYKLISSGDPDIEDLEARVEGRVATEDDGGASGADLEEPPASPEAAAASPEAPTAEPGTAGPWIGLGAPSERRADRPSGSPPAPPDRRSEAAAPPAPPPSAASSSRSRETGAADDRPEPFGDLAAGDERRRYLDALGGEGIFPAEVAGEDTAPDEGAGGVEEPRPTISEPPAEPSPEPAAEPTAAAAPTPSAEKGPEPREGDRPTVTLGRLYLDQGHPEEAQAIFEKVLARDPENEAAQSGLERAREAAAAAQAEHEGTPEAPAAEPASAEPVSAARFEPAPSAEELPQPPQPPQPPVAPAGFETDGAEEAEIEEAAASPSAAPEDPIGAEPDVAAGEEESREAAPQPPAPSATDPPTARDLLGGDPEGASRQELLRAYLDRIRSNAPRSVEAGGDVS